jgi:signal transduction histidine kinase
MPHSKSISTFTRVSSVFVMVFAVLFASTFFIYRNIWMGIYHTVELSPVDMTPENLAQLVVIRHICLGIYSSLATHLGCRIMLAWSVIVKGGAMNKHLDVIYILFICYGFLSMSNYYSLTGGTLFITDAMGVMSTEVIWSDWVCTVPLFMYSLEAIHPSGTSWLSRNLPSLLSLGSIIMLFMTTLKLSAFMHNILFIGSCITMFICVCMFQLSATMAYFEKAYHHTIDLNNLTVEDAFRVAVFYKFVFSTFTAIIFILFPLLYVWKVLDYIDNLWYLICLDALNVGTKGLFLTILTSLNLDVLSPGSVDLLIEKKSNEKAREHLLRYIFHEIRVPLNTIVIGLNVFRDGSYGVDNEEFHYCNETMIDATSQMSQTLNDVISFKKIEEGRLDLEPIYFDPIEMVYETYGLFRLQFERHNLTAVMHFADNLPSTILGDKYRLQHVLGNFLSNSVKFSDQGSDVLIEVAFETR